jgi:signal transduction histidine kinase
VIFLQDVSAIENQAQQLKLASMGRLTASIAHEVSNPLSAIGHATALLAEDLHGAGRAAPAEDRRRQRGAREPHGRRHPAALAQGAAERRAAGAGAFLASCRPNSRNPRPGAMI